MPANKIRVFFTNDNVEPSNYQMIDFDFDTVDFPTENEVVAQVLAYVYTAMDVASGANTRVDRVTIGQSDGGPSVDVPFPNTEYQAIRTAANAEGFNLPSEPSYAGNARGGGGLAPLGTSISVTEITPEAGRHGRGRHFLPYITGGAAGANGYLDPSLIPALRDAYRIFIMDDGSAPIGGVVDLHPVVTNAANTAQFPIVEVKPQQVFSNLESRRR